MMSREIRANCPECGQGVDGASGIGDAAGEQPEVGNLAICIFCAGVGVYEDREDGTLGLRLATTEEKVELYEDDEFQRVRDAILAQKAWMQP